MTTAQMTAEQLSFNVELHPALREKTDPIIEGSLAIAGSFNIRRDLQAGETITVQMIDADGELLATGQCEVGYPAFKEIKDEGEIIGTERVHKAKLVG